MNRERAQGRSNPGMNGYNGSYNERSALLKKIQALSFAKAETELFLNTHPECANALSYYKDVVNGLNDAVGEYSEKYGPITAADVMGDRWTWVLGEWPWQNAEKED